MRILFLLGLMGCWSAPVAQPRAHERLTAADVGLPSSPGQEGAGDEEQDDAAMPSFSDREQCLEHDGCVLSRDVTIDRSTMTIACTGRASYTAVQPLRELTAQIEVGEGGLELGYVRPLLVVGEPYMRRCFDRENVVAHVEVAFGIVDGHLQSVDPSVSPCLRDALAKIVLPRSDSLTSVRWTFDYSVKDPRTLPPLVCPGS